MELRWGWRRDGPARDAGCEAPASLPKLIRGVACDMQANERHKDDGKRHYKHLNQHLAHGQEGYGGSNSRQVSAAICSSLFVDEPPNLAMEHDEE